MNFVEPGFVVSGYFVRDSDTVGNFRFDGLGKIVFVNAGVTAIDIGDLYSRWLDWMQIEDNAKFSRAMRYSGKDPIPGGYTGTTFFMSNGWRVIYDANTVAVNGVLYSDDYPTAYWTPSMAPIYPATVAALVNASVSVQNVVTGDLSNVPEAVWAFLIANANTAGSIGERLKNAATIQSTGAQIGALAP